MKSVTLKVVSKFLRPCNSGGIFDKITDNKKDIDPVYNPFALVIVPVIVIS